VRVERDLWLNARFLSTPEGAAAQRDLNDINPEVRHVALVAGDRLAAVSVTLAQQCYRHAAAAWQTFGPAGFARWLALGAELATVEPACRDGAEAYFNTAPEAFGDGGVDTATAWCALGRDLLRLSRKLGGVFFRTTATVMGQTGAIDRLRQWVVVATELYREHGWRGEFLAQAYLSAAPEAVVSLHPAAYRLWAAVGAVLHEVRRDRPVFDVLPEGIAAWTDVERELFLQATLAIAGVAPKPARAFYDGLPPSLVRLSSPERITLLRTFAVSGRHIAGSISDIVPVAGSLVRQVPAAHRLRALSFVNEVATHIPQALVAAIRSLPRLYEEADATQVERWFAGGLRLAADNLEAGMAYFALESRTSLRVLHAGSTAIDLEEAQGVLRKYIHMLSGSPASLRGIDRFRLLLPLEEFPQENEVAIPIRVDLLGTCEENFRLYRFAAAQLAGRREFGTYDFIAPVETSEAKATPATSLSRYLSAPDQPELLEPLFLLAEGFRIHCRLSAAYRGLAEDGGWVGSQLLQRWRGEAAVGQARILDSLFAFLLAGAALEVCPSWIPHRVAAAVVAAVLPLARATATVQDSVRVAHELANLFESPGIATAARDSRSDAALVTDLTGDARLEILYDHGFDEEASSMQVPGASAAGGSEEANADERMQIQLDQRDEQTPDGMLPIGIEDLKRLLDAGVKLDISQGSADELEGIGLYASDLIGKVPIEELQALRRLLGEVDRPRRRSVRPWVEDSVAGEFFYYDEWDYHIGDYRSRWCRLREVSLEGDSGEFFHRAMMDYSSLIPEVRTQFQRIRPEMYRNVRGLEDGEDFDLNAAVEARVELRARRVPSGKLYVSRQREERDVATLFLIDMSASTDEPLDPQSAGEQHPYGTPRPKYRRIVDVTKEALVVMATALEDIGDAFAIYGFSGNGRNNVEFYRVKSFTEPLNTSVKGRIGEIQPQRGTRMGTALRHAVEKMASVSARSKHLFLLSDGFPQDHDYGQDRRSNVYGIRDTAVALKELETVGITPFCITVDKAGHDYLRQMCDASRYMVIEDVAALPRELPKIYQRITRGWAVGTA
jgi:nitric oxide reductase NorD protein